MRANMPRYKNAILGSSSMPMNGSMGMRGKFENLTLYFWDPLWVGRHVYGLRNNIIVYFLEQFL